MSDELTLRIGRRGAALLYRRLIPAFYSAYGDERAYLQSICSKLHKFINTPTPKYVEIKVISVNGVPAEEYYGRQEDHSKGRQKDGKKGG